MTQGWIKLHRGFTKFEWYQDANTVRVFLHLLITANHKEAKWQGNVIGRGQLITSREHLSRDLGLTVQVVRTSLLKLEKSENVTIKTTNRFTLLSICNYDTYQSIDGTTNPQVNQQITNKQPTDNQQITTNKNDKNKKNEKNEKKRVEVKPSIHRAENIEPRIIKLLSPSAKRTELNPKERSSLDKVLAPIEEHDMELLEFFFSLEKSKNYDQTWKRKQGISTILNNLQDQLDLAYEMKESLRKSQPQLGTPTQWS